MVIPVKWRDLFGSMLRGETVKYFPVARCLILTRDPHSTGTEVFFVEYSKTKTDFAQRFSSLVALGSEAVFR